MAEPLKNSFDEALVQSIARQIRAVYAPFSLKNFVVRATAEFDELTLTERAWDVAHALRTYLPPDYGAAIEILIRSLGPPIGESELKGMEVFRYLPHVFFVAHYGLDDFERSMTAQYELTKRFTAEFSIRYFIEKYPQATLERLHLWVDDPSPHVRRLVSEGTRPRLPWARALREFKKDPRPVLELLEKLKDDPELYVRRSVANNLNDIGKDHPDLLAATCRQWLENASPEREQLVRHALRSAIKRGEAGALAVVGADARPEIAISQVSIEPARPARGGKVRIGAFVENRAEETAKWVVDLGVFFVKMNGETRRKVFKLKAVELAPGGGVLVGKTISLADLTTRAHFPGRHPVELVVNGFSFELGAFDLE